jgi:glycine dehydrogenase subunit 1
MSLLGSEGLRRVALQSHANTMTLARSLASLDGVSLVFQPFFHEAVLRLNCPVAPVIETMARQDILAGYDLSRDYPELGNALLVCATEMRTAAQIDSYVAVMKSILKNLKVA